MAPPRPPTVALVGNPNTGKTTLFNALSGLNQRVGNYPGVTVEIKKGKFTVGGRLVELVDLPGTYSLAPRSPDEMVAVELVLGLKDGEPRPDVVVAIADASNLERNLYLTTQVLELGLPVVLALNMTDVAEAQGVAIDADQLSKSLGIPVVALQANTGRGLDRLRQVIDAVLSKPAVPRGPTFPDAFEDEVRGLAGVLNGDTPTFLVRRLLLDVGGYTEKLLTGGHGPRLTDAVQAARHRLSDAGCGVPGVEARARYGWIRSATAGSVRRPAERRVTLTDRLDRVLTHRVWGTLLFLAVMFVVFQSIYFAARPLMDLIGAGQDALAELVKSVLGPGPFRSLVTDGVIAGVGGVLVFLPQIMILFAFVAVLEDCGYMARAAFLMDRLMARAGLNGKSFIPLLSSVACAVPGIMSARVIENPRDRLATIVVAPLMSCSARLPVYLLLLGAFLSPSLGYPLWAPGLALFGLYLLGLVVAPLVAFCLKRTLLRGETPVFVMEMPLYRLPSLRGVARRSFDAGMMFVRRAGTLILASMVVVWALLYFPSTDSQGRSYEARRADLEAAVGQAKEAVDAADEDAPDRGAAEAELRRREEALGDLLGEWKANSALGRVGKAVEPAVRPLGWDWRVGMAAIASFPAREVMVGTLGIIFSQGEGDAGDEDYRDALGGALREATWEGEPGRPLFTLPVALSVMVFFALCCQCVSTLAVIRRETNSWRWPAFTFVYMTALAYVGALVVYQLGRLLG